MSCQPSGNKIGLAAVLAALLAVTGSLSLAASPAKKDAQDGQTESKAAKDSAHVPERSDEIPRTMRRLTARQGTPVLGLVVGKRLDVEAAEVLRVWPGSPAAEAGLQAGDRIVKVGEEQVKSPEALRAAVLKHAPGDQVAIEVACGGQSRSLQVRLAGADGYSGWARRGARPGSPEASGWLGIRIAPAASAAQRGVLVTGVFPGSPAHACGLRKGDAILRVDKTRMEAATDLKMAIAGRQPGEKVKLLIDRDGERKSVEVQLGAFAQWQGEIAQLTEEEVRDLVRELMATPLAMAEELLPTAAPEEKVKQQPDLPTVGVASLVPTEGNDVRGSIMLRQEEDGLHITGEVTGLKPGSHGFHIHQYGDARDPHAKSAGGHFNPTGAQHGGPRDEEHHAGDLGNIQANKDGVAEVDIKAPWLKLHFVIGRSIVVHAGEDDLASQPSGDAGSRVAIGVIGIAEASQPPQDMAQAQ